MSQLIDLCGTPIQLDRIKDFRLVKRECLYYPAYQETDFQTFSLFARLGDQNKKKFKFVKMVPFGILLGDKEKPTTDSYEFKSFGEYAASNILANVGKKISNAANIATDMLRIDTSGNKEFRILTAGRRITEIKLRDVPARVRFLSGKESDVYKNDPNYQFLGESIAPIIEVVSTLVITIDKTTLVFFGGGIDLENAEPMYQALFEAYNQYHASIEKQKAGISLSTFKIPKFSMPAINLHSPFLREKSESEDAQEPVRLPQGLSANETTTLSLDDNTGEAN